MSNTLPRLVTGITGLDAILGGGFVEGASYIIQGQPGAGKTILGNQIAFATAAAGKKVLYITLLAETHDRLFQSLSTLDFFEKDRLGSQIVYLSVFHTLSNEGLKAVVELLRKETKRQDASLIVFDGLLNARDRAETDLDIKTFVAEVQGQAAFVGCTVLFLTSARLEDDSPEHTMVDGVLELHDELVGVRTVRRARVRKSRGSAALGGFHQYEIADDGISIFPRIEAAFHTPSISDDPDTRPLASGIEGLDLLTGGGLPCGSTTLLIGPSGSGKTSFGINFLAASSVTEPALHFGFYETPKRLLHKAKALGLDLQGQIDRGELEISWHPLTENLLDKLAYRLLDAVSARGVKRLFVDSFGGFERAAIHRPRLVEFFAALTNELRAKGVTTVATWEMRDLFASEVAAPARRFPVCSIILFLCDKWKSDRSISAPSRCSRFAINPSRLPPRRSSSMGTALRSRALLNPQRACRPGWHGPSTHDARLSSGSAMGLPMKIVVAEDEFLIADMLVVSLEEAGHEVSDAPHGAAALKLIREAIPDLVITDFMMPLMTGLELAEAMRADETLSAIPIVLVSGAQGAIARQRQDLFDVVIDKPYAIDRLLAAVDQLASQSRSS